MTSRSETFHENLQMSLRAIKLEPGEIVVLRFHEPLTAAAYEVVKESVARAFGPGQVAVILDAGVELATAKVVHHD